VFEEWQYCPHLKSNLKDVKYIVKKHGWDMPIINWGIERSGKSMFSAFMGFSLDENYSIKNVAISDVQIKDRLESCDRGDCVVIDEGGEYLFGRDWNKTENKSRIQDLFIMGTKGLIIIINTPTIDLTDIYLRSGRLRFATNVWTVPKLTRVEGEPRMWRERGFFSVYTRKTIVNYYKRDYYLNPSFNERFPDLGKLPETSKYWTEYEKMSREYKLKIMKDRNNKMEDIKVRADEKQVMKDARRLRNSITPEDQLWADRTEARHLESLELH
jgi:hypothetical protein